MGAFGGLNSAGIGFAIPALFTYVDMSIPYKNPMSENNPYKGVEGVKSEKLSFGIGIGPHLPIWNFSLIGGIDFHIHKSTFSVEGTSINSSAKYKTLFFYFAGLEYNFSSWFVGIGYGSGRGPNLSVGALVF